MSRLRRCLILLLCCLGLGGCAVPLRGLAPDADAPLPPLADALFAPLAQPVGADDLFALSPEMRAWLAQWSTDHRARQSPERSLIEALYDPRRLALRYDDGPTRTAAQAFAERRGNCLSLVVMTAALARALGLEVDYRLALRPDGPDDWQRSGGLLLHADHVNLVLSRPHPLEQRWRPGDPALMIDFVSQANAAALRTEPLDERLLVAMYLNNRAVETLSTGQVDAAYWWARAAVQQQPGWSSALNTLAVVYMRAARPALAEQVLQPLLARQPANTVALGNLVLALDGQGRAAEAQRQRERLALLEPQAPGLLLASGRAALQRGDVSQALAQFEREAARYGPSADLAFWRAQALWRLGRPEAAGAALAEAESLATDSADRRRYQGKRAWLRDHAGTAADRVRLGL